MKDLIDDIKYIFLNYIICNIPFWPLRRLLYILSGMKIGAGSRILMKTKILSPGRIEIGDNTFINENCFLDGRGGIKIGSNVTVAIYSKLITGGHFINDEDFAYKGDKIYIGDHVVIFTDSLVLAGAFIEDGCVFSARSVIKKGKYDKLGIYSGNPAKCIGKRQCDLKYKQDYWHPILR